MGSAERSINEYSQTYNRGASEIYIENHKGILSYTDTEIRVSTPMGIVRVFGNGLSIDRIRLEDILISGQFKQIEYEI